MNSEARLACLVAGEANVDLLMNGVIELSPGEEKLAGRMDLVLGGSSAITAFNLARMGLRTGFTGILGKDAFGDFVEARLRSGGVDLSGLRRHPAGQTGITIWHSKSKKRAGVTFPGTLALLQPRDIHEADLKRSRHLHVGHYFLLTRLHSGSPALFRKAKALGLTTSLDCNHDPTGRWDSNLRNTLRYADIFLPNEFEAKAITGERTAAAAARRLGDIVPTVVVKMGAKGVYVFENGSGLRVPAVCARVVDTTGAGDSFNAGYLSQFLGGRSAPECAIAGVQAAARSITRAGGTAAFVEAGR